MGEIIYQVESGATLLRSAEIKVLFRAHYDEVVMLNDVDQENILIPNPDYEAYDAMEKAGVLHAVTMRDNGKLVGYCISFITRSLRYKDRVMCFNDAIYISPKYRGLAVMDLLAFTEADLKLRGVTVFNMATKAVRDFGRVLELAGFNFHERVFRKFI